VFGILGVVKFSFKVTLMMEFLEMFKGVQEARSVLDAEPKKVEATAQRRLRFILNEAYRKVPFYSKRFRSKGITLDDVKNTDDLSKLPILTRKNVQDNWEQMLNQDFRPNECFLKTTSGSTGEQVVCLFDPKGWYHLEGIALRGQFRGGLKLGHKVSIVTSHSIARNGFYKILSRIGRLRYASVFDDVPTTLSSLHSFGPHVLKTYPSFLRAATETSETFHCPLIFSMSEVLDQAVREHVETVFDARIIDLYGAVEFTSIAWECNVSSLYHLDADAVVVEAVKLDSDIPANPGEPARILVTGLLNRAMPLIRYDIGDIAVLTDDECSCGVKLPLMSRIEGRRVDCIRLPSGRLISPYILTEWIRELVGIRQYQIIQEERNRIVVKIVPRHDFDEKLTTEWTNHFSEIFGEHVTVEPELVSSISLEKRAKYRYVMSKVN
jgi:phenylacetate-coenzyme A ligase PaaK-like adenylate-forming protein